MLSLLVIVIVVSCVVSYKSHMTVRKITNVARIQSSSLMATTTASPLDVLTRISKVDFLVISLPSPSPPPPSSSSSSSCLPSFLKGSSICH